MNFTINLRSALGMSQSKHLVQKSPVIPLVPETIGGFKYAETLHGLSSHEKYIFALYTQGPMKAIAKFWHKTTGRISGRRALCSEIKNHKILAGVSQRQNDLSGIRIPRFYDFNIEKDVVWMLTEYVQPLNNTKLSFEDYILAREYLKSLGAQQEVRAALRNRFWLSFVIGFPLVWLGVVAQGSLSRTILYAHMKNYLAMLPTVWRAQSSVLCHLDLKSDNVLYSPTGKYVIDFQSTAYAPEMLDYAFSLDRALLHKEMTEQCTTALLGHIRNLPLVSRRFLSVLFSYGLLYDLFIEKENAVADNRKYLSAALELI